ncbi:hypothetical protein [Antrihabitans sp. YC2-6]|uniref:hypothetical protein n=1 Tax=Antrihabitans sp. YC2-6 TaxID=2799498 RepID=UPI0018F57C9D|nr:hypothetical protein [Antrihabitans sp. YC2-6]MBJ8345357.1 hypothetical protein [Antrihabitans sp. YC2-6]
MTLGEVRPEHDRQAGSDLVLIHYVRGFAVPVLDVWEFMTEAAKLPSWFGSIIGDPESGRVTITTLDESLDVQIDRCTAPHRLAVTIDGGVVEVALDQIGVVTSLELVRRHLHPDQAATVGPRWQYYLDCLEAAVAGQPLPVWSGYADLATEY